MTKPNLLNRQDYIGGSDMSSIIGKNPFKNRNTLLRSKVLEIPEFKNNAMNFGNENEEFLINYFSLMLSLNNFSDVREIVDYDYGFPVVCHLDGLVKQEDGTYTLLECKTGNTFLGECSDVIIPEYYITQIQTYLYFLNKHGFDTPFCYLLFGERKEDQTLGKTNYYKIPFIPNYWENVLEKPVEEFIKDLLYAKENPNSLKIRDDVLDLSQIQTFEGYLNMKLKAEEFLESFKKSLLDIMEKENIVKFKMGDFLVNYIAESERFLFDEKAFKEAEPELFEKYANAKEKYQKKTITKPFVRIIKKEGK